MKMKFDRKKRLRGGAVLVILGILIVLIVAAALIVPRFVISYMVNKSIRENPQLRYLPQPLLPAEEKKLHGELIQQFGFEFSVPWGPAKRSENYEYFQVFDFADETRMYFYDPAKQSSFFNMVLQNPDTRQREAISKVYGMKNITSRFEAFREVMSMLPPESVSPFMAQEKLMSTYVLLGEKERAVPSYASGVYEFEWGHLRGFQMGLPADASEIRIHVFDDKDFHLQFNLMRNRQGAPAFTQSEINFLVKSVRRTPAEVEKASPEKKSPDKPPVKEKVR